ncbi:MAG: HK97 gp10 family phage protein [Clostridia bacterium]|nr:HK97 gp10 family phage protein [Clostridia bacterium]
MSVQGLDSLLKKLNNLGGNTNAAVKKGVAKATKKVQGDAKDLAPVNYGELRQKIEEEVKEEGNEVIGEVAATAGHSAYIEFGTGPVGRVSPKDLPPGVEPQYREGMWWIHESQIDPATAEQYHFIRIETEEGIFYGTYGQPAQPYLYPAMKQNEEYIKETIAASVRMEIKKVGK